MSCSSLYFKFVEQTACAFVTMVHRSVFSSETLNCIYLETSRPNPKTVKMYSAFRKYRVVEKRIWFDLQIDIDRSYSYYYYIKTFGCQKGDFTYQIPLVRT
jgi:hypothetical protein